MQTTFLDFFLIRYAACFKTVFTFSLYKNRHSDGYLTSGIHVDVYIKR